MRVGEPGARPLDDDDAQAELFGGAATLGQELATRAEGAVEPQHHRARRVTEFRVAEPASVGEVELTFRSRLLDTRDPRRMPQWVVHQISE